jgi:alkylation response protein AidB-like acyl-CoA dehydrogenase
VRPAIAEGDGLPHNAAMRRTVSTTPTADELFGRAVALLPAIRAEAEANERNRVVAPHLIERMRAAELFRIMVPRRFGGFEQEGELALRIAIAFAGSCASTAWCGVAAMVHAGLLAGFPLAAQHDIWDENQDALVCGSYAPGGPRRARGGRLPAERHIRLRERL